MKPIIHWIAAASWRPVGDGRFEALRLRRGRFRVMAEDSMAYFYIEDASQMKAIYDAWSAGDGAIELEIYLEGFDRPETIVGILKPEAPPYTNPPYHLKLSFKTDALSLPLVDAE